MGALAAMGAILAASVAADSTRARVVRAAAAAALPALALGLYLSFSRGALAALAVGVLALALLGGTREGLGLGADRARDRWARDRAGHPLSRRGESERRRGRRGRGSRCSRSCWRSPRPRGSRRRISSRPEAAGRRQLGRAAGARGRGGRARRRLRRGLSTLIPAAGGDSAAASRAQPGADAALPRDRTRLRSLETNRFRYWEVALDAVGDAPLHGLGSAGFATLWLERAHHRRGRPRRPLDLHRVPGRARDRGRLPARSLPRRGARRGARPPRAGARGTRHVGRLAGRRLACSSCTPAVDWDWEMPAVALVFVLLVAATLAARDAGYPERDRAQIGGRRTPGRRAAPAQLVDDPDGVEGHPHRGGQRRDP